MSHFIPKFERSKVKKYHKWNNEITHLLIPNTYYAGLCDIYILFVSTNVQGAANSTSWDKSNLDLNFFIAIKTFWKSFYSLLSFESTMALKDLWHQLSTSKIYGTEDFNLQKEISIFYVLVVFSNIRMGRIIVNILNV